MDKEGFRILVFIAVGTMIGGVLRGHSKRAKTFSTVNCTNNIIDIDNHRHKLCSVKKNK